MMSRSKCLMGAMLFVAMAFVCGSIANAAQGSIVQVKNQYIQLTVGSDELDTGRFSIDTTGGDPGRTGDESQPLIYGGGKPGTSVTTIRVDGKDFVYGGKTQRRAGKGGQFGVPVRLPSAVGGQAVLAEYRYGDVSVEQNLSLVESPSTGLMDSVRVMYVATNTGSTAHSVGVRVLLDTMLGSNDGAPFRIGDLSKASAAMVRGTEMPDFWQAFDSISQPKVVAQGTLIGQGLTQPDRMYFVDWGTPADDLWNFSFEAGAPFLRKGEGEPDSASVLFWDPRALGPGESRAYATIYGLGGISIAPGALAVGITSPATVEYSPKKASTFPVLAYIENTGEVKAKDVMARLDLPAGLRLVDAGRKKGLEQSLGDLRSGDGGQATWTVEVVTKTSQTLSFSVAVSSGNAPANVARRSIRVEAPPAVGVSGRYVDGVLQATIRNPGPGPIDEVVAKLILPKGLRTAGLESSSKPLGGMEAGETFTVTWQIDGSTTGNGDAKVFVTSSSADPAVTSVPMFVTPSLRSTAVRLSSPRPTVAAGEPFAVDVWVTGATALSELEMDFTYDSSRLDLLRVSRGTLMIRDGDLLPWTYPDLSALGKAPGAKVSLAGGAKPEGTALTLHGVARTPGVATVSVSRVRALGLNGKSVILSPQDVKITIK